MSRIQLQNLSVHYPLHSASARSIKSTITSWVGGRTSPLAVRRTHHALKNIDLTIEAGDRICLIGLNGAGKTTLLKTLAGIYPPSSGQLHVEGDVSPLLDFATGFELEMAGYDNIIARGLFLGYTKREMIAKRSEIADFSGLGDFLYEPVKTYSSGMFIRLAFAIVTSIEPDILVIDEIVGAGDQSFATKAQARMLRMIKRGRIVVMATHSTELALQLCNRAVWLHQGEIVCHGEAGKVIEAYTAQAA